MPESIKLIYIAGPGRCGSTLLARLLGEVDGFFNVGEALKWFFDTKNMGPERPCACGSPVFECQFWRKVSLFIKDSQEQKFATNFVRIRNLPILISPYKPSRLRRQWERLLASAQKLFFNIQGETHARCIVDSSKNAASAFVASQIPGVELYLVHLVRDARGMVSSWIRPKGDLESYPAYKPIFWWLSYNLSTEWIRPWAKDYLFIRYEDFVESPEKYIARILDMIGENTSAVELFDRNAHLHLHHMVAGNPDRQTIGKVEIKLRPWKLPWYYNLATTVFTFPLLVKYGYIWPNRHGLKKAETPE
ncbi:MAG: hypothetical protein PGMFKBFP_01654 [Anaerolineales bacterium]|nr:hypothetical protein [Anaerolineales bacterium]NOG76736.1 hypothetical protein [Chloroflexota bacterium]GIK09604.1 MAG: sulfotransferase [Chloroflexota bacterium]HMN13126.1 sulfotransferase [Bellilinea sp.]HPP62227.1 sulfotransferase [Anaerolineales bacterium]